MPSKRKETRDAIDAERVASNHRTHQHSTVWNQIRAIAAKQGGCRYRSVRVADARFDPTQKSLIRPDLKTLNAGQEAMANDPKIVNDLPRDFYLDPPIPSEVKDTNEPFDHARWGDGEINAAYTEL